MTRGVLGRQCDSAAVLFAERHEQRSQGAARGRPSGCVVGTPIEARSAFARLVRDGSLADAERLRAVKLLDQLRHSWDEIQPSEKVRRLAEELPDRYGVRAADATQLAAAATVGFAVRT